MGFESFTKRHGLAAIAAALLGSAAFGAEPVKNIPAFPGAEGAGMFATGGRGGEVYEVTTLNDDGPGSFRDAVSKGHRIIVFRVSGTIQLKSKLDIKSNDLTIAGQTAPGDGVCFRDYCVYVYGNNIVIRHLRFRLGDETKQQSDSFTVWKSGAHDLVIDHCSVTWSVDEALSLAGDEQNVTVQWCLIGESLRQSVHVKGPHGFGSLSRANGPITWHHNLWVHNDSRNPRLGDNYGKPPFPLFDVRNNVMYDYGSTASGLTQGNLTVNYIGNYLKPGPDSKAKTPIHIGGVSDLKFYIEGNVFEADPKLAGQELFSDTSKDETKPVVTLADKPFATAPVTTTSAKQAYDDVLANVGANVPKRDSVDQRILEQVRTGTGHMINSQTEVGGWPELKSAPAPVDTDHDGMPDTWEKAHGLNPNDPADAAIDSDHDGYTNIEEYLNQTDPKAFVDYMVVNPTPTTLPAK